MIIKIRNPLKQQKRLVPGPDGKMHLVVSHEGPPKLRFAPRTAQQQAAAAAPAVPTAQIQQTRVMRKVSRELPPKVPFLRFDTIVGRGGMAVVWRAWHLELKRPVAVKVLDAKFSSTGQDVRQFMMEVRTMSNLHHQGIVQGYGADFADGRYYFIMDYVDGYTFGSLLNRKAHIPEIDVLIVGESVADAMKYAWDNFGIVHCDLKPENIMVDRDGTIKVTDLGLCQSTAAIQNTEQLEEVVGTPAYISPEQIYGDVELDCRADIYCLGATLYHMATGRMLFPLADNDAILRAHVSEKIQAPDPRFVVPSLSEGFARLVSNMCVKERERRYQTWDEVFNDARAVEEGGVPALVAPDAVSSIQVQANP